MARRSEFIATATLAAVVTGAAAPATAAGETATGTNGYAFDRAAFERRLARPVPHRQVFGAVKHAQGIVLHYMRNALDAYREGFGEGPGTLHVAAVLYGPALAAVCPDALWTTYGLTSVLKSFGETFQAGATGTNPHATDVASLVADGASFFVCNNALHEFTQSLADGPQAGGAGAAEIYAAFYKAVRARPSVIVVPAGVAALNAAQEAHFTYVAATSR